MQSRNNLILRPAKRDDVPAIIALLADDPLGQTREDPCDLPAYLQAFDEVATQRGNFVLVAERAGAIVGCLQLTIIPGLSRRGAKRGQIEAVRVSSACRGLGIGEQLLRHSIQLARAEGCGLVQLTSDNSRPEAHRFYERLGFAGSHIGFKLALD